MLALYTNPRASRSLIGGAEFCHQDGRDLAVLCRRAGVKHELVWEWAQLHVFALGSAWVAPEVRARTDGRIVEWIKGCVS